MSEQTDPSGDNVIDGDIDFHCHVCGKLCDSAPSPPSLAICEICCVTFYDGHDYEYDAGERSRICTHCGIRADAYYDDW